MTEFLSNLFSNIFGDNIILATVLIAMIPIMEIKGAIAFATNPGFWGELAMNNWTAMGWSLLGDCAIVPIIALVFLPLMNLLKKTKFFHKLAIGIENRIRGKSKDIEGADEKSKPFTRVWWKKVLAVFAFVSIPLPFTGVWTGTCIAVFIGLDYFTTCVIVILGNIVAGVILALMLQFFPWLNNWLFYIFIGIVLLVIVVEIIRHIVKKRKEKNGIEQSNNNEQ